ncbi:MAG: lipid A biosynthesis acyltransferase [Verrucomicrobiota bacterium]
MPKNPARPLWHPLNWPMWLGLWTFRLVAVVVPFGAQLWLGRWLGRAIFYGPRIRRRVVETNLRLCFPELSELERRTLARRHFEALGMGVFELCTSWYRSPERMEPLVEAIEGLEHLERLREEGRGALLLTAHFTTLEMTARLLSERVAMGALFRSPKHPVVAHEMRRIRALRLQQAVIHFNDLRGLLRALKGGAFIWYAPDQGRRAKFTELLPFFGELANTNVATARVARMSGCAVVPFFGLRTPSGRYRLRIGAPLEDFPSGDDRADALRVTALIEDAIRQAPEQYFWVHKRFKRRGDALPDAYK